MPSHRIDWNAAQPHAALSPHRRYGAIPSEHRFARFCNRPFFFFVLKLPDSLAIQDLIHLPKWTNPLIVLRMLFRWKRLAPTGMQCLRNCYFWRSVSTEISLYRISYSKGPKAPSFQVLFCRFANRCIFCRIFCQECQAARASPPCKEELPAALNGIEERFEVNEAYCDPDYFPLVNRMTYPPINYGQNGSLILGGCACYPIGGSLCHTHLLRELKCSLLHSHCEANRCLSQLERKPPSSNRIDPRYAYKGKTPLTFFQTSDITDLHPRQRNFPITHTLDLALDLCF